MQRQNRVSRPCRVCGTLGAPETGTMGQYGGLCEAKTVGKSCGTMKVPQRDRRGSRSHVHGAHAGASDVTGWRADLLGLGERAGPREATPRAPARPHPGPAAITAPAQPRPRVPGCVSERPAFWKCSSRPARPECPGSKGW